MRPIQLTEFCAVGVLNLRYNHSSCRVSCMGLPRHLLRLDAAVLRRRENRPSASQSCSPTSHVSRSVHELVLGPVEIGAKRCRRRQLRPLDVLPKRRYRQLVDTDRAVGRGHRSGAGLEARHGDVERDVELRLAARFDDEA
jgi:hypothetical protein